MNDVFAMFDIWVKLSDAGKIEGLAHLRALQRAKAPASTGVSA